MAAGQKRLNRLKNRARRTTNKVRRIREDVMPKGKKYTGYDGGGPVETEDQRSKRMEKEDANVRGYWGGGGVKIKPYNPGNRLRQVFKKERGYGQAQEGGTGLSGGGKVKKYGGGGKVKKKK